MERIGLLKNKDMGSYELEKGYASYRTVIEHYIDDLVLCNNIAQVDESVYENLIIEYDEEFENLEIYQYFLCNLSEYEKEQLLKANIILSYSNMLDCDVLCVTHWGTSWDYVLTDVKLFDTYEELKAYENEEEDADAIPLF